jgi:transcriptional regulator with XRE-family HTH domain
MTNHIIKEGTGSNDSPFSDRVKNQIKRGEYIRDLMNESFMNRHQIAKIAGLSDSYVKGLEDGVIANPKKPYLIHLGVALNLELEKIDALLEFFNQPKLTRDDASLFIEVAEKRELTKTLQPLYGRSISIDLLLISMERIKGELVVFNDKLPLALMPKGYASCLYDFIDNQIYSHIVEQVREERVRCFMINLKENKFNYYTTKSLLLKYIRKSSITRYKDFLIDHILNLIDFLSHDNFNFKILGAGPQFRFSLKYPAPSEKTSIKLFFLGHAPEEDADHSEYREKWLRGFATDDANLVKQFDREYKNLEIGDCLSDKETIKDFVIESLLEEGNISKEELTRKKAARKKSPQGPELVP